MDLLASAPPSEVTPAVYGMAVIILMQFGQFYFAFRRDQRSSEAAKKEDLTALKAELKKDVEKVKNDVDGLRTSWEKKEDDARKESARARDEINKTVKNVELQAATLLKGQETTEQTLAHLTHKIDTLNSRSTRSRP